MFSLRILLRLPTIVGREASSALEGVAEICCIGTTDALAHDVLT